jgi:hypothetical protein
MARPAGERRYLQIAGLKVAPLAQVSKTKVIIAPATGKAKFAARYPGPLEAWLQLRANAVPLTSLGADPSLDNPHGKT